jgi:hypothetical protein
MRGVVPVLCPTIRPDEVYCSNPNFLLRLFYISDDWGQNANQKHYSYESYRR